MTHDHEIELLSEEATWRARTVKHFGGTWPAVRAIIPEFELVDFKLRDNDATNPFLKTLRRRR
jgi:hypothetical protein